MMNQEERYQHLSFTRRIPLIPRRWLIHLIAGGIFTAAWLVIPRATLYWLLLPAILTLVWVASFGWQEALSRLITLLQTMEERS